MPGKRSNAPAIRLAYCSNVHPAETLVDIEAELDRVAVKVRNQVARRSRLGVGLWLPNRAVEELFADPTRLETFAAFLVERRLEVFTLNAFPFGGFHQRRVKGAVFQPSWAEPSRLAYTRRCAEILARLLPEGGYGSISTCPVGLPAVGFDRVAAVENLRACARTLLELEERTSRRVVLALEPEPSALLETVSDAIEFLDGEVFLGSQDPLRAHLGVCLDACHEAVMFEDAVASLDRLVEAGIVLGKLQLSSAIEVRDPFVEKAALERLRSFDEGRYFHQLAFLRRDGSRAVFQDLSEFFAHAESGDELEGVEKLRVHFHVPIFAQLDGPLTTTRGELGRLVQRAREMESTPHFEIETYTFDVIPEAERAALGAEDLPTLLAREWRQAKEWLADSRGKRRGASEIDDE